MSGILNLILCNLSCSTDNDNYPVLPPELLRDIGLRSGTIKPITLEDLKIWGVTRLNKEENSSSDMTSLACRFDMSGYFEEFISDVSYFALLEVVRWDAVDCLRVIIRCIKCRSYRVDNDMLSEACYIARRNDSFRCFQVILQETNWFHYTGHECKYAIDERSFQCFKLLVEYFTQIYTNASMNIICNSCYNAVINIPRGGLEYIHVMLKHGWAIPHSTIDLIIHINRLDIIKFLFSSGVKEILDKSFLENIIQVGIQNGKPEMVEYLKSRLSAEC